MADQSTSIRTIMQANGDSGKQVWVTEYGAPTSGPGDGASLSTYSDKQDAGHVDEEFQSYILKSAITSISKQDWVGGFFWYSYKDLGTDTDDTENFFGMLRADGSKKPAYQTIKEVLGTNSTTP
jgi:exo-beta-1,3-glucanase (GH17 family)